MSARLPSALSAAALGAALLTATGCQSPQQAARDVERNFDDLVQQLARLVEPRAVKYSRALEDLKSTSPDKRRSAILFLGGSWRWSSPEAEKLFADVLQNRLKNDPDELVRLTAAGALARHAHPEATKALTQALADKDGAVRAEAAGALAGRDEPAAVTALLNLLRTDPEARVRAAAAAALGDTTAKTSPPVRRRILTALVEALDDRDFAVVHRSQKTLAAVTGQNHQYDRRAWEEWLRTAPP